MNFSQIVKEAYNKEVRFARSKVEDILRQRETLANHGIIARIDGDDVIFSHYTKCPKIDATDVWGKHEYVLPPFADEVLTLLKCATDFSFKSVNIGLVGPKGSGKSEFVREVCAKAGFAHVFQVNGREQDISVSDFYGEKTVVVDPVSQQNYITFVKGGLYRSLIEGTQLDENGDQMLFDKDGNRVYDATGEPRVVGKPGAFFLDEYAALLPGMFLAIFNRVMEIPRQAGLGRTIEITTDGGRIVKSHPGFVVFLSGNTFGKGTETEEQMGYTAQNNLMDDSTLDRISVVYYFGYNLKAEKEIIYKKLKEDINAQNLINFRNEIRKQWSEGKVETLLSTRAIVQICDQAQKFEDYTSDNVALALYRTMFSQLREKEKAGWNETARFHFKVNLLDKYGRSDSDMWYPTK